jgi:hypothetical protein
MFAGGVHQLPPRLPGGLLARSLMIASCSPRLSETNAMRGPASVRRSSGLRRYLSESRLWLCEQGKRPELSIGARP